MLDPQVRLFFSTIMELAKSDVVPAGFRHNGAVRSFLPTRGPDRGGGVEAFHSAQEAVPKNDRKSSR